MSTAGAKPATATKLSSVALGKVRLSQVEFSKGGQRGETEGGAIPPTGANIKTEQGKERFSWA